MKRSFKDILAEEMQLEKKAAKMVLFSPIRDQYFVSVLGKNKNHICFVPAQNEFHAVQIAKSLLRKDQLNQLGYGRRTTYEVSKTY